MKVGRGQPSHLNEFYDNFFCCSQYMFVNGFHKDLNIKTACQGQEFGLFCIAMKNIMVIIRAEFRKKV